MAIKTSLDTSVLISGWQGQTTQQIKALTILSDPQRTFVCSPFVRLELIPKATYYRNQNELQFYNDYFTQRVSAWVDDLAALYNEGMQNGVQFGLKAMDALYIAAAMLANCDEFITAERPTSPFSRVTGITVVTIY